VLFRRLSKKQTVASSNVEEAVTACLLCLVLLPDAILVEAFELNIIQNKK